MPAATSPKAIGRVLNRLPLAVFGIGVLTALSMIFVGWRGQNLVSTTPDPYGFASIAHNLLLGRGFANCGSVLSRRGPLYPAMIAFVYLVTGERPIALQLVQALMLGGISVFAFYVGRDLFNPRTGLIAGIISAVHPVLLRYVPDVHLETFLTFLCTLTLWRSVLFLKRPGMRNGALFGLCAALAVLTKPVVLLYPVAFAAWWLVTGLWSSHGHPQSIAARTQTSLSLPARAAALGAIFFAMAVVILPWTYRNYRSSGHFVLVTTGAGDAFLRGYFFSKPDYALLRLPPYTNAENECNAAFQALCLQAGTVWGRDDIETEKILSRAAKERLRADPGAFVRKFGVQLITFWYEMTNLKNSLIAGLTAGLLWIFAILGWRRARTEGYVSWPLFLPIFCLNVSLAVLLALGRYSVPVLPALGILAAFGIDTLIRRRTSQIPVP